jgi:hypothetical protein
MNSFSIETDCQAGGVPHKHAITVEHGEGAYGASSPTNVRLQFTCPMANQPVIVTFKPPAGAARPFAIAKVV